MVWKMVVGVDAPSRKRRGSKYQVLLDKIEELIPGEPTAIKVTADSWHEVKKVRDTIYCNQPKSSEWRYTIVCDMDEPAIYISKRIVE